MFHCLSVGEGMATVSGTWEPFPEQTSPPTALRGTIAGAARRRDREINTQGEDEMAHHLLRNTKNVGVHVHGHGVCQQAGQQGHVLDVSDNLLQLQASGG